jgi:hypothetical protein
MESMRLPNVPLEPGLYPEAVTPPRKPHDALGGVAAARDVGERAFASFSDPPH